jgi:photosystem II stability/assembly factor-like uncharacterized protein
MSSWRFIIRRSAAALAVLMLAGCGTGLAAGRNAAPSLRHVDVLAAAGRPAWIDSLQMVSATAGWALVWTSNPAVDRPAALDVARTSDGGRIWTVVTPAAARLALAGDAAVLTPATAERAYLAVPTPHGRVTVYRTIDGGRTWRASQPFGSAEPEFLDFVTASDGWLLASEGAAMQQNPVELYRTTDGGQEWRLAVRPGPSGLPVFCDKSGLAFRSPDVGWIVGDCNELGIWMSVDGGRHWARQALPMPDSMCEQDGCALTAPAFFGRTGFFTADDPPDSELLLVSADGGAAWSVRTLPRGVNQALAQFFSATSGIAIPLSAPQGSVSGVFYVTSSGGQRWRAVRQGRRFGSVGSVSFDFVSAATGFAWRTAGARPLVYATADSGRTWTSFVPRLAAPRAE